LAERTGLRPSFDQHRVAPADAHGGEAVASNAQDAARRIWKDGYRYDETGLITTDLMTLAHLQRALIGGYDRERSAAVRAALDACNARFGRGVVFPASAGVVDKCA
jgi:DNA polymerase V